ncbi:MAG: hypothetical protein ACOYNF_17565 [Rhodoferax sp.]
MSRFLIPDSGPLFSLAAGNLLGLLTHFRIGITDIVRQETIDQGLQPNASAEAQSLQAYYNANANNIETFTTQVGTTINALRTANPDYQTPRNMGELSIQSLLIDWQLRRTGAPPVILFEDAWFMNHAAGLAKPCTLLSTQALLDYAQSKGWIKSAMLARQAIARCRPLAYQDHVSLVMDKSTPFG